MKKKDEVGCCVCGSKKNLRVWHKKIYCQDCMDMLVCECEIDRTWPRLKTN